MLKYIHPNPVFHLIAVFLLIPNSINSLKQTPRPHFLPILFMYLGFSLYDSLLEFSFVPYYVISFVGLRNRDYYVFLCSILVGLHLYYLNIQQIIGHIMMNLGRAIPTKPTALDYLQVHLIMFLCNVDLKFNIMDIVAAISAYLVHMFPDDMDIFSACMMLGSNGMLKVLPIHVLELDWYLYYKNNHFKKVYESYNFMIPLAIWAWALSKNVYT